MPGVDKTQYYQSKFGVDRTSAIFSRLSQVGADVGITFKFGGKTGNSRESHRLIQLGAVKQKQTEVVEQLFKAYFEEEKVYYTMYVVSWKMCRHGLLGRISRRLKLCWKRL